MEQNNFKKRKKQTDKKEPQEKKRVTPQRMNAIFEAYTIISYFVIEVGVLMAIGFFAGRYFWPETMMKGILCAVGGVMGIISFMLTIWKRYLNEEKRSHK